MSKKILFSLLGPLVFFGVWQFFSNFEIIDPSFFPAPFDIFKRMFFLLFHSDSFLGHILKSSERLLIALLLALPFSVIVAILIEFNNAVRLLLRPMISLLYPLPKVAIFPLLLLIFGIGDASKVAVLFLGMFFLILLNVEQGLRRIMSLGYMNIATVYRIPFLKKIYMIAIRGVLPEILTGIKMAIGNGLVLIVASEFTIADKGIGVFIWSSWDQFQIQDVYVGIFILSIISFLCFLMIDFLISRLKA